MDVGADGYVCLPPVDVTALREAMSAFRGDRVEGVESDPLVMTWIRSLSDAPLFRCVLFRNAGTCWHQDGGSLWRLSEVPPLQVWMPLDDATRDGLEVVPGSHGALMAKTGGVIPAPASSVFLPTQAGGMVAMHPWLKHRTAPGRLSLSAVFMRANTKLATRTTS